MSEQLAIGVDVGGTKIAAGVVDAHGVIVKKLRVATPAADAEAIEAEIVRLVRELSDEPLPVGVAVPGFIDAAQSEVYFTPNVPWRNTPLRADLEAELGRTVVVDNDANAAGWAEYRFGAGRGHTDVTLLTIGTGLGGAIIVGGQLIRGGFGAAAELGHVRVVPDGVLCGCGQRGCLEQYTSGRAFMRLLNEVADDQPHGELAQVRAREGELNAENVEPLMFAEEPGVTAALENLGRVLGQGCASIAAVLDPQRFIFGGGVAIAGESLLRWIRAGFEDSVPARGFHPEPSFAIAEMVNDAGIVGAADLARIAQH